MNESIQQFLSLPLWLTIPLTVVYAALWCWFIFVLLRWKKKEQ